MQQAQQDYTDFLAHQAIREGSDVFQMVKRESRSPLGRGLHHFLSFGVLVSGSSPEVLAEWHV